MNGSRTWFAIVVVLLGAGFGLGSYTFAYAHGWSYMTDDPRACANCHVMNEQYDGWVKSSHRSVAVCNDCHVPHSFVAKYATKARNGFWHSYYFTSGTSPSRSARCRPSRKIAEANCRRCHEPIVQAMGDARTRRLPRHLLYPVSRVRRPHGARRNQRR